MEREADGEAVQGMLVTELGWLVATLKAPAGNIVGTVRVRAQNGQLEFVFEDQTGSQTSYGSALRGLAPTTTTMFFITATTARVAPQSSTSVSFTMGTSTSGTSTSTTNTGGRAAAPARDRDNPFSVTIEAVQDEDESFNPTAIIGLAVGLPACLLMLCLALRQRRWKNRCAEPHKADLEDGSAPTTTIKIADAPQPLSARAESDISNLSDYLMFIRKKSIFASKPSLRAMTHDLSEFKDVATQDFIGGQEATPLDFFVDLQLAADSWKNSQVSMPPTLLESKSATTVDVSDLKVLEKCSHTFVC